MRQRYLLLQILCIVASTSMLFSRAFTALSRRPHLVGSRLFLPSNRPGPLLLLATRANTTDEAAIPVAPKTKMRKTQLKTDLKEYRLQQASPLKKPAYTVFPNSVLEEIYTRLPTTHAELLDCKGIGPKKTRTLWRRYPLHRGSLHQCQWRCPNLSIGTRLES